MEVANSKPFFGQSRLSATALLAGTVTCLSLVVLLGLFAAGLGLMSDDFHLGRFIPLLALVIVVPFLAAGALTGLAVGGRTLFLHAVSVWGLTTVILVFLIGSQASAIAGGALKQFGITAGANLQTQALIQQISDLRPTFVTTVQMDEGKAQTTLVMNRGAGPMSKEFVDAVGKEAGETLSGATSSPEDFNLGIAGQGLKSAAVKTTWSAFAALVVALLAIIAGTRLPRYRY